MVWKSEETTHIDGPVEGEVAGAGIRRASSLPEGEGQIEMKGPLEIRCGWSRIKELQLACPDSNDKVRLRPDLRFGD